ncbi:hypothetical protein HK405_010349 [Cladochytrium tenue]|nr:hypothetical protein HK405_010349 [Cladochytrium tenue]
MAAFLRPPRLSFGTDGGGGGGSSGRNTAGAGNHQHAFLNYSMGYPSPAPETPIEALRASAALPVVHRLDYGAVPWGRIFRFLSDFPEAYETLRDVCVYFRSVCVDDTTLRAQYFMLRHLVVHFIYQNYPLALTTDLMDTLVNDLGALLPKRLIEVIAKEQNLLSDPVAFHEPVLADVGPWRPSTANSSRKSFSEKPQPPPPTRPLPSGSLDFIVAIGFRSFGDALILQAPDQTVEPVFERPAQAEDDSVLFYRSLSRSHPDLDTLRTILFGHHFIPALDPPTTADEWDDLWFKCIKLLRVDPEIGRHVFRHSGWPGSPQSASDALVARALRDPASTDAFFRFLGTRAGGNHAITREACVRVLASPTRLTLDSIAGMSALDLMRTCVPGGEAALKGHARAALVALFEDGRRDAIRAIDSLLMEFELDEEDVAAAFLADGTRDVPDAAAAAAATAALSEPSSPRDCIPRSFSRAHLTETGSQVQSTQLSSLPFMTTLGRARGGMTDMLWQLVLARYGPTHPFAAACVVDLVIGGTLKNPVTVSGRPSFSASSSSSTSELYSGDDSDPIASAARQRSRYSVMMVDPAKLTPNTAGEPVHADQVWIDETHDDRDRDAAARDSLEAILDGAGVPIDPGMLAPVAKSVLVSRTVRPRLLDFMSRIESGLLLASFGPSATDADRLRWSRVRWVAALRRHVLDSRAFLEHVLSPSELAALDERRRRSARAPDRTSGIFAGKLFAAPSNRAAQAPTAAAAGAASATDDPFARRPVDLLAPPGALPPSSSALHPATASASAFARSLVGGLVRSAASPSAPSPASSPTRRPAALHAAPPSPRDTRPPQLPQSAATSSSPSLSPSSTSATVAATSSAAPSPFARLLASVVDLVDPASAEIRRFYAACDALVALLEDPALAHAAAAAAAAAAATSTAASRAPFALWLRDADARAARAVAAAAAASVEGRPPRPLRSTRSVWDGLFTRSATGAAGHAL